jgi:anti-sigma28 factor (negative regulator of flagellin synthesis)
MPLRIDDNFSPSHDLRSTAVGRTAEQARTEGRAGEGRVESTDSASLSALSVQLARALEQEPPELFARIEQLRNAVANGTYDVPNAVVSASIVDAAVGSEF